LTNYAVTDIVLSNLWRYRALQGNHLLTTWIFVMKNAVRLQMRPGSERQEFSRPLGERIDRNMQPSITENQWREL
jgi:hypothetical protein